MYGDVTNRKKDIKVDNKLSTDVGGDKQPSLVLEDGDKNLKNQKKGNGEGLQEEDYGGEGDYEEDFDA